MKMVEIKKRSPALVGQLLEVWQSAVEATHHFLTLPEIQRIETYVPQTLTEVPVLAIAESKDGSPVSFMGIARQKLEMLFISNVCRRQGIGRALMQYGMEHYSLSWLTVNKQNPEVRKFYESLGFHTYQRTERDEEGNSYPLIYMKKD